MTSARWAWLSVVFIIIGLLVLAARVSAATSYVTPEPTAPNGGIATAAELATARTEWAQSAHADTYDNGMGANTTCARCKSPFNWDPSHEIAQQEALDCGSCKRIPNAPRPDLPSGVVVKETDWRDIPCEVCHVPSDDSFYTGIAFWNQALGQYETVASVDELCAHCHKGRHGFEVIEEQAAFNNVHANMECSTCHDAHGSTSKCTDCHDPMLGRGAPEHVRHPSVNCTGCHDNGGLSIWYDSDPQSTHYGEYITRRFAHTITSWPSHNLTVKINCKRCHHPLSNETVAVVPHVSCDACHTHENGAVWVWCTYFDRNPNPNALSATAP